jgi:hypothetical protein
MVNSVLMYDALGVSSNDPRVVVARESIDGLLIVKDDEAYCQPCLSPIWDTVLASHALLEVGSPEAESAAGEALAWLKPKQVLDVVGDWAARRPEVRPGGTAPGHGSARRRPASTRRSSADANGSSACRARTAAGVPSTPTTRTTISTTSRSPITARCSTRRPPT